MTATWRTGRARAAGITLTTALTVLAGCTADRPPTAPGGPVPQLELVAFDSCADALAGLRAAAKAAVTPWGLPGSGVPEVIAGGARAGVAKDSGPGVAKDAAGASAAAPDHSDTNVHEAGVDEPDLVKTDGRRIVTVGRGVLQVVDPATRRLTGRLDLATGPNDQTRWAESNLLLHGDRALVLVPDAGPVSGSAPVPATGAASGPAKMAPPDRRAAPSPAPGISGPRLVLVDLTGPPKVISEYRTDGRLVDARQVGGTTRIVVRSAPRLTFRPGPDGTDAERIAANRAVIDGSTLDDWLPRHQVTTAGRTSAGRVACERISRPDSYSGASVVTVLSFDLAAATLTDGDPASLMADGDTVYSNGTKLYVASDDRWRSLAVPAFRGPVDRGPAVRPSGQQPEQKTRIHQFDVSKPGPPRYLSSAEVPGYLVNQYAISDWNGHLRVATTTGETQGNKPTSRSTVYVFRADDGALRETGRVTGLGKGERIYAVRFDGGTGYVVTFRQTDPLYTVDLRDPTAPKVTGELKITGYSSYLHPLPDGRLIGVGQEASAQGRVQGSQVSLFDVRDPARPVRLGQHLVKQDRSEAEHDPHALLYWPASRLLVIPTSSYGPFSKSIGALALRVDDNGFTELGVVNHPASGAEAPYDGRWVRRSLVADGVLWTISDHGMMASDLTTVKTLGWIPLN
jgi:hypothetical protein